MSGALVGNGVTVTEQAHAYETIRLGALHRLERDRIDPQADLEGVRAVVAGCVDAYQRRAHLGDGRALADPADMTARVLASITDFGPLSDLFARSDVEEIFIEGGRVTFIDTTGRLQGSRTPTTEQENRQLVDRLLATTQRTLDASTPLVQARVLDGKARLTAAQDPVAEGLSATIRRHLMKKETLRSLVERGSLSLPAAGFLWALMQSTSSVVTSGPPGAGKTSLLSAMLGAVPSTHCVRCCEEIRELFVPLTHGAYYEARPPALDGSSEVSLRDLVKFVLAMRPDLIVVGEVRGSEAFELTRAVNAGTGFACTVHANSARDALNALVNAAIMAGENVREDVVRKVFSSSIDFVVHLDRDDINRADPAEGIRRQVMEIIGVVPALTDDFSTEAIFLRPALGKGLLWTGVMPRNAELIERSLPEGMTLQGILEGRVSPL
ncbi:MAG: Flp pilus assembly complex ATPase component TadA [Actinobacteria bacterium]|nr:Flp pilus assembly complex ATPase component TadA [Actinomycetota bacterium]